MAQAPFVSSIPCRVVNDLDIFFPDSREDEPAVYRDKIAKAKAVCQTCPLDIKAACLAYAVAEDIKDGIWGGLTRAERKRGAQGNKGIGYGENKYPNTNKRPAQGAHAAIAAAGSAV